MIVAVDGPAGSGKGTVTKKIEEKLGLINLDTGATYRCVALASIKAGLPLSDEDGIVNLIDELKIEFKYDNDSIRVFLNDKEGKIEDNRLAQLFSVCQFISDFKYEDINEISKEEFINNCEKFGKNKLN